MGRHARLEPLVGEWKLGDVGRVTFEWLGDLLVECWTSEDPFPSGIAVIGDFGEGLRQHYFDERGVGRIYEMSLEDGVWRLSRDDPDPFPQRFVGTFSEDGAEIRGVWEKGTAGDGGFEVDFEMVYSRA